VRDAGRLFAAFDLFVLSSRTEGTPIVLFEAMGTGVPIVATRVGGVPDVVSPAEAVLVPPDDPLTLAGEIRAVYRNPAGARERARRARERLLRDFSIAPWLGRYEAIYRLVGRATLAPLVP
jgi:glycosyltransferase involved in cell wall biosynthesis